MTRARATVGLLATATLALAACSGPTRPATSRPAGTAVATTATAPPASPLPPTTTLRPPTPSGSEGSEDSQALATTDRLQRQHALARVLPHQTAHYRIDDTVDSDGRLHLQVTLLAVLNDAGEAAAYATQLRQYKAEALAFIQAQGDDPRSYTIAYLPPEAAAL